MAKTNNRTKAADTLCSSSSKHKTADRTNIGRMNNDNIRPIVATMVNVHEGGTNSCILLTEKCQKRIRCSSEFGWTLFRFLLSLIFIL